MEKLADALQELQTKYRPDRIFIETSGSSLPAPLAREINRFSAESLVNVELDAIVCVIDAVNFPGYKDKSTTAKIQAKFTNLILINKHEVSQDTAPTTMKCVNSRLYVSSSAYIFLNSSSWSHRINWIV